MYKIVLFSIALLISTSNLLAEFDTLWTKNDNRLINAEFAVLDENTILTYMWVNSDINSNPNISGNEIKLVKYNVKDQTFTEFSSIYTEKVSIPKFMQNTSINISKDKSKVFALEYNEELETTIINIFNTADGSLKKLEIENYTYNSNQNENIKNHINGNISLLLESTTEINENDGMPKPLKQLAIIDLDNFDIEFIDVPNALEYGEAEIYGHQIINSQVSNSPEVIFHFSALYHYGVTSYLLDGNIKENDARWSYVSEDYFTSVNRVQFVRNDEFIIYSIKKGDNFVFNVQETESGIKLNQDIVCEINNGEPVGRDYTDENIFLKYSGIQDPDKKAYNYSIFDVTTQKELETIYLDFYNHEFFGGNGREINRIKAINDSTYFSVIDGILIKFLLKDYQLSVENPINLESIYPNPTKENIILDFELERPEQLEWQIIDINGRELIANTGYFTQGRNKLELKVANLENGIYFLKLGNKISKFVISR